MLSHLASFRDGAVLGFVVSVLIRLSLAGQAVTRDANTCGVISSLSNVQLLRRFCLARIFVHVRVARFRMYRALYTEPSSFLQQISANV